MQKDTKLNLTQLNDNIFLIKAQNQSLLTFKGTNTYIVGKKEVAIIDPGPNDLNHYNNILNFVSNKIVKHIIITHSHDDHCCLAEKLSKYTKAKVYGFGRRKEKRSNFIKRKIQKKKISFPFIEKNIFQPPYYLEDKQIIKSSEYTLEIIYTPGHLSDHICIAFKEKKIIFTGDHIMGWSTSLIAVPDGDMSKYIESLKKISFREENVYYPGHGLPVTNGKELCKKYIDHRLKREKNILDLFNQKQDLSVEEITKHLYKKIDNNLFYFAKMNVFSHLISLIEKDYLKTKNVIDINSKFIKKIN